MKKEDSWYGQVGAPQPGEVIVIAGPTASGKTALAVELALKFNGEVISADSRQVYRGLDIGSAKVTEAEMKGVVHHLIDILDPGGKYNVAQFQNDALSLIKDIEARGKIPIICGGTGLYIESVVEGYLFGENLTPNPSPGGEGNGSGLTPTESEIQSALAMKGDGIYSPTPSPSPKREGSLKVGYNPKFRVYLLSWPRDELRRRIAERIDFRMDQGMLAEVQNLLSAGVDPQWLISLGLEYRYLTEHLLDPNSNLDETIAKLKFKSYQFAKRQDTWFRRWKYAQTVEMMI